MAGAENRNSNKLLANHNDLLEEYKRRRILYVVMIFILVFWTMESALSAFVFHKDGTFFGRLFDPRTQEFWKEFIVVLLFILFGVYFRRVLTHMKMVNLRLKWEVAERRKAEQAYKHLHIRNELILDSAGEGIYGLDLEGKVTFANAATVNLSGYKAEELIGQNLHKYLHHTKADGSPHRKEECPIFTSLKLGEARRVTKDVFCTKDGRQFPVEYVTTPMHENGQLTGAVVIFRDIAARLQAEEQLKKERDFISTLMDTVSALVVVLDPQGRIVRFNPACEKATGYAWEEVHGGYFWEILLAPAEAESGESVFLKSILGNLPGEYEAYLQTRQGDRRLIAWSHTALRGPDGALTYIISTGIDITERRRAEEEVAKAKEYLENVLENSADAIGIVDRRGKIIKWNKASTLLFGYSADEMEGKSAFDLYADKNELDQMLAQLRRDGSVTRYEIHIRRKAGTTALFALSISLLHDQQNQVIGSVCVARDQTEIKQSMADLEKLNEQMQNEISERKQVQSAWQEANTKLLAMVEETEGRNRDITLLNEMGDLLQACLTCEEAYSGIAHFASQLFPDLSGALYTLNPKKNLVEAVATWGNGIHGELVFPPEDCWALRRGEINFAGHGQSGLVCQHLAGLSTVNTMCIPMAAQGEISGMLLLQKNSYGTDQDMAIADYLAESKQRLASTLTKQISLALANLSLRETLRRQAIRDPLTGLFNRRYMEETLEREIQRIKRRHKPLAIIMVDLDRLKPINDTLGHEAGDQLLGAIGRFLKTGIRREDIACRYGGDEFTLILPETTLEAACMRTEELRQGINHLKVSYQGQPLEPLSASFGVAVFPDHGQTADQVIRAADTALYLAKQEGRNRLSVATVPEQVVDSEEDDLVPEAPLKRTRVA